VSKEGVTTARNLSSFSFVANFVLAIAWAAMIPVTLVTGLKSSVPFLVAISLYALVIGHVSSALAAKTRDEVVVSAEASAEVGEVHAEVEVER
jgi:formate hydrogenlyase subunit 4